ncbi:unnamed protein product [Caenorhabditis angaria]|uniref:Cytochrome-b5 reductase n=1 Tax=Caenorhabditis angaria TaxID=860376 RepID=A0A9P1MS75_9PELO|nr:unnamed protein product [Caenorhabditis angaria]
MNNLTVNNSLFAKPAIGRSEYGRVKVALAPGKGFMDWLRLTQNKALAKRVASVDHVELSKHDKKEDCWVHLFGIVYDVTQYLEFHPGGIPELLRAAGRDATPLFNQYHAWVNYESMLKACIVGPFNGDLSKLKPCLPPTTSDDKKVPASTSLFASSSENFYGSRIVPIDNGVYLEHDDWTDLTEQNVIVSIEETNVKKAITSTGEEIAENACKFRVLVHHFWKPAMEFEFDPSTLISVSTNFKVSISPSRVSINFPETTQNFGDLHFKVQRRPGVSYHKFQISNIFRINYNTLVYRLEIPSNIFYRIPVGHHVSMKIRKGQATLYRPYTPIMSNSNDKNQMDLMIKIYEDGICTPSIEKNLKIGDFVEISDPIGDKKFEEWIKNSEELVLLAAGSGITPMIDILTMRLDFGKNNGNKTSLLIFNKTENDVATDEKTIENGWKLAELARDQNMIKNIIGQRISTEILKEYIDKKDVLRKAFICGPDGFIITAKESLEELGLSSDDVHIFQG